MKQTNLLAKASTFILWRGIFLILFGLLALFWAGPTLWALVLTFGFFAIVDGIILITVYSNHRQLLGRTPLWFGIISILIGVFSLFFPGLTAITLGLFIGIRTLFSGIMEFRMGTHLRKHIAGEILLIINGIISILFAIILIVLLIVHPVLSLFLMIEFVGIYAIFVGATLITLSSKVKKVKELISAQTVSEIL